LCGGTRQQEHRDQEMFLHCDHSSLTLAGRSACRLKVERCGRCLPFK
jgi:hypothetical protein